MQVPLLAVHIYTWVVKELEVALAARLNANEPSISSTKTFDFLIANQPCIATVKTLIYDSLTFVLLGSEQRVITAGF
jgi:hypothetical protein